MTYDVPQIVVVSTVWLYWSCVLALIVRSNINYRTPAGGMPRTRRERWMWMAWVPLIVLWHLLPLAACFHLHPLLAVPGDFMRHPALYAVRAGFAGLGTLAWLMTLPCWLRMGRDWSIAVVPQKTTRLITEGMFARIRHPIYALNMLLMVSTMIVVPSPAMVTIGLIHLVLIYGKTTGEEKYLHQTHGPQYADYCARTGRYLPRRAVQSPPPAPVPLPPSRKKAA